LIANHCHRGFELENFAFRQEGTIEISSFCCLNTTFRDLDLPEAAIGLETLATAAKTINARSLRGPIDFNGGSSPDRWRFRPAT